MIMNKLLVQIQISQYKRLPQLQLCISSILKNCNPDIYRLYVIDDCPEDRETKEWLKECSITYPKIEYFFNEINLREQGTINKGIDMAIRDEIPYVMTINNDVIVTVNDWLESTLEPFEKIPDRGPYLPRVGMVVPDSAQLSVNKNRDYYEEIVNGFKLIELGATWAACVKTELFKKIGNFNTEFFSVAIDLDFCKRMKLYKWNIAIVEAKILHDAHSQVDLIGKSAVDGYGKVDQKLMEYYWGRCW